MSNNKYPLIQEEFNEIYSKVPRLTVEIIMRNDEHGVYLTKRAIEPCKDQWHLPGGTVRFGEKLTEAVERIADRELGIKPKKMEMVGCIDYPSHYNHGLDSPVGIVFEIKDVDKNIKINHEALEGGWFKQLPAFMHADQDVFLLNHGYVKRKS
jgi:8-oxo-dGTP pyrophosphatase MutT (NUDIX family)